MNRAYFYMRGGSFPVGVLSRTGAPYELSKDEVVYAYLPRREALRAAFSMLRTALRPRMSKGPLFRRRAA